MPTTSLYSLQGIKLRSASTMRFKIGIKISFAGTAIEATGMILDIFHHINIGIKTAEGLITFNHLLVFIGFIINFVGVLITWLTNRKDG